MPRAALLLLLGLALALGGAACAKDEGTKSPPPADDLVGTGQRPELGLKETERGLEICDRFVARLCACADKTPSFASDCRLARAMPEALRMVLRALNGDLQDAGPVSAREGAELEAQARKTVAMCIRKDGELDPAVCPR